MPCGSRALVRSRRALCPRTVAALARLADELPPAHARLRRSLMRADGAVTGPLVDRMVREHDGAGDPDAVEPEPESRPGAVEHLVELVASLGELFTGTDGATYVRLHGPPRAVLALGSRAFRETVAHAQYRDTGRAPKAAQLADALTTLAGIALHEAEPREVHLRVAVDPAGGYLIDLCDDGWRAVRCTPAGWQVLDESPVVFRRTSGMKPLPEPARDGTRADLVGLFNVEPDDEELLTAALVETLRPDTPDPIVEFCGEQGSGKTRSAKSYRALTDPHEAPLRAPPRSIPDVYVGAGNNRVLGYDNVSSLPGDMQDAACVISTGGASATRTLYTDADETTINVKRTLLLDLYHDAVHPSRRAVAGGAVRVPAARAWDAAVRCRAVRGVRTACPEGVRLPARHAMPGTRAAAGHRVDRGAAPAGLHAAGRGRGARRRARTRMLHRALYGVARGDGDAVARVGAGRRDAHRAARGVRRAHRADRGRVAAGGPRSARDARRYRTGARECPRARRAADEVRPGAAPDRRPRRLRRSARPSGRRVSVERVVTSADVYRTGESTCTTCTTCTERAESARRARCAATANTTSETDIGPESDVDGDGAAVEADEVRL